MNVSVSTCPESGPGVRSSRLPAIAGDHSAVCCRPAGTMVAGRPGFLYVSCRTVGRAVIVGLVLLGFAGCSSRAADGAAAGSTPSTSHARSDAAPKAGAPAWCRTLDSPAVTALSDVLPQLVTKQASVAAPKVRGAAMVLRHAAASAPAGPGRLLTAAASSLDSAADAKSAASLQAVGTAFTSLSKGVQSACGFH